MSDLQDNDAGSGEVPVLRRILDGAPTPGPWEGPRNQAPSIDQPPPGVFIDPAPTFGSSRIADLHQNGVPDVVPAGEPLLGGYRPARSSGESARQGPSGGVIASPVVAPPRLAAPDPATVVPVPPPPLPVAAPSKRSPVLAILLGLVIVAAAAFAFLWHKASADKDSAQKQVAAVQTELADSSAKSATDLSAAKKAADAAAAATAAASQQALDAANAQAAADAKAAAAQAQADQAAAVAKAAGDAQAAGQTKAAGLQTQLDAANAAIAAAKAKTAVCKSVSDAVTAMVPNLNELVKLRDADISGDTATSQSILSTFDRDAFNAQVATLNSAQAACNAA